MATITSTEKGTQSGFVKLAVTLENGTKIVKEVPEVLVSTVDKAKVYLRHLDIAADRVQPQPVTPPVDFTFLNGVTNVTKEK